MTLWKSLRLPSFYSVRYQFTALFTYRAAEQIVFSNPACQFLGASAFCDYVFQQRLHAFAARSDLEESDRRSTFCSHQTRPEATDAKKMTTSFASLLFFSLLCVPLSHNQGPLVSTIPSHRPFTSYTIVSEMLVLFWTPFNNNNKKLQCWFQRLFSLTIRRSSLPAAFVCSRLNIQLCRYWCQRSLIKFLSWSIDSAGFIQQQLCL